MLELTATPKKGNNIISVVDARKLKKEEMVKLPVIVYNQKKRIIIVSLGFMDMVMVNPVIVQKSQPYEIEEGCLSLQNSFP